LQDTAELSDKKKEADIPTILKRKPSHNSSEDIATAASEAQSTSSHVPPAHFIKTESSNKDDAGTIPSTNDVIKGNEETNTAYRGKRDDGRGRSQRDRARNSNRSRGRNNRSYSGDVNKTENPSEIRQDEMKKAKTTEGSTSTSTSHDLAKNSNVASGSISSVHEDSRTVAQEEASTGVSSAEAGVNDAKHSGRGGRGRSSRGSQRFGRYEGRKDKEKISSDVKNQEKITAPKDEKGEEEANKPTTEAVKTEVGSNENSDEIARPFEGRGIRGRGRGGGWRSGGRSGRADGRDGHRSGNDNFNNKGNIHKVLLII
jgi:hypothetical protein